MQRIKRPPKPALLQVGLALGGLLLFGGIYLAAMHFSVDVSRLTQKADSNRRDLVYLAIHGGLLLAAAIGGFVLGRWLNGLGLAYAMLFVIVLTTFMIGAQATSYELACEGHNDLIRHWTC